jgi:putative ABC transport system substrate-binding protein
MRARHGDNSKLPELLQDFKASGVDVIVTDGYPPTLAAKTAGIPTVVASGVGDPVATGLLDSLARPGGTVTGISDNATTLCTKRLSLLKELLPKLRRIAMLWNADDLAMSLRYDALAAASRSMSVAVQPLSVRVPKDFIAAFEAMDREPPDAIMMVSDTLTVLNRKLVFDYALARRLPAIYENDPYVRAGGLMSYGADRKESFERAAALVDRIFKGAKPAYLPFEQPMRYLFVINLNTAKAMGLEIPPHLLALADELIE